MQRRLPWSMTFETSYVGSKSDQLRNAGLANINIVPFGAMLNDPNGNADAYRPFQLYGDINVIDAQPVFELPLVAEPVQPPDRQFSFTGAYTFSKALGIRGGQQGRSIQPPDLSRDPPVLVRRARQRPPAHRSAWPTAGSCRR